jgi:spore germination protein
MGLVKRLDFKNHRERIVVMVMGVALVAAIIWAGVTTVSAQSLDQQINSGYDRGYNELLNDLENLETSLAKLQVTSTSRQYTLQLMDIWRQSGETKAALEALPVSQVIMGDLSAFITRLGDYCYMLGRKVTSGSPVESKDLKQLKDLQEMCVKVRGTLKEEFEKNRGKFARLTTEGYTKMPEEGDVALAKLAQGNTEYPHLIYDGPYSESRDEMKPKSLEGLKTVDEKTASQKALDYIGKDKTERLDRINDLQGVIECYGFKGELMDESGDIYVYVTKKGGKILMMSQDTPAGETVVPDDATLDKLEKAGQKYLAGRGFKGMVATYSQYYDGLAVINFAGTQDGVLLYPDLIKVSVRINDSMITGVDARNYIMAHQERTLKDVNLSPEEAEAVLNTELDIQNVRLALIPKDDLTERVCYEFSIKKDGTDFLVYIDALNGEEAEILQIIHTNEGSLVM